MSHRAPLVLSCVTFGLLSSLAAGCGGGGSGGGGFVGGSPNSQTIGPSGGNFTLSTGQLAGTSISVPAGAVSQDTPFTIDPATVQISAPNVTNMGTTVTIGPAGTNLSMPITVTLPFPVSAVDTGMTGDNVFVVLSGPGGIVEIVATTVNLSGTVTFTTNVLGSFVVAKRPMTRQFVITSGPVGASAGITIAPPITVSYQDQSGTVVTSENIPATASLGVNPVTGSTLTGTLVRTPAAGVATFSDLVVSMPGSNYRLDFKAPGVRTASTTFSLSGNATNLAFTQQPANAIENGAIPVTVQVLDANGQVVTGYNGQVTLAFAQNPSGAVLGGVATANAVNGVANLSPTVSRPGVFFLNASATGTNSINSQAFTVSSPTILGDGRVWFVDSTSTRLLSADLRAPQEVQSSIALTGLAMGETLDGIDFRPATGQLYGLTTNGTSNRLVVIDRNTGAVTQVGATLTTLTGTSRGFDFNPMVDRIRVVANDGSNLRLHPDTGAIAAVDSNLNGAAANAVAAAYQTNVAGAPTQLMVIDAVTDSLYLQNPPNAGTLTLVGALGSLGNVSDNTSFDIVSLGAAFAAIEVGGTTRLFRVDLTTGTATQVGGLLGTTGLVRAVAIASTGMTGLTTGNALVTFNTSNPREIINFSPVTGLQPLESLVGIDYRPFDNRLFGLGSTGRVYQLALTGVATQVGMTPLTLGMGTDFGFDFNPTVDRIRIVNDADLNLRANPNDGALAVTDVNLQYAVGDPNAGANPNVAGSAYINNSHSSTATTLFGLDSTLNILVTQNPPNNGTLNTVGSLGVDITADAGFDVIGDNIALAALNTTMGTTTSLYTVNTASGVASIVTDIDNLPITLRGLTGVVQSGPRLYVLDAGTPQTIFTVNPASGVLIAGSQVTVSGLQMGETLVGIDFRPATGELFGLGSTSRLYLINSQTGVATQVGTGQFATLLNGTSFGVDFNPTVDRVRVVSEANQNLRLNPATGGIAAVDSDLAYAAGDPNAAADPNVTASAYLNNFVVSTATTLFGIDSSLNILVTQIPPNNGTLNTVGALGVTIDAATPVSFDITPSNATFAAFTVGGVTGLYSIDLATGAATLIGSINGGTVQVAGIAFGP